MRCVEMDTFMVSNAEPCFILSFGYRLMPVGGPKQSGRGHVPF